MLDRRQFIRFIAVMAAGAAALPEQIETFTKYYEVNTPLGAGPFIAVDEINCGGLATHSLPVKIQILRGDAQIHSFAWNAFGGMFRWAAMPDQKIIARPQELTWRFSTIGGEVLGDHLIGQEIVGNINYIGPDMVRRYSEFKSATGLIG